MKNGLRELPLYNEPQQPKKPQPGELVSDRLGNKYRVHSTGLRYIAVSPFGWSDGYGERLVKIQDVFVVQPPEAPAKKEST